jgi:hypothetical protein
MPSSVGSIERIKRTVCIEFGVLKVELESHRSKNHIAIARMVAMALARQLTSLSLNQVGRWFGNRHHTAVLYACKRMSPHVTAAAQTRPATPEQWVAALGDGAAGKRGGASTVVAEQTSRGERRAGPLGTPDGKHCFPPVLSREAAPSHITCFQAQLPRVGYPRQAVVF